MNTNRPSFVFVDPTGKWARMLRWGTDPYLTQAVPLPYQGTWTHVLTQPQMATGRPLGARVSPEGLSVLPAQSQETCDLAP